MPFPKSQYWHLDIHPVKGSHRSSWGPPIPDTVSPHIQQSTFRCISCCTACWEHVRIQIPSKAMPSEPYTWQKGTSSVSSPISSVSCLAKSVGYCALVRQRPPWKDSFMTKGPRPTAVNQTRLWAITSVCLTTRFLTWFYRVLNHLEQQRAISVERRCIDQMASLHSTHGLNIRSRVSAGQDRLLVSLEQLVVHVASSSMSAKGLVVWYIDDVFSIWTSNEESLSTSLPMNSLHKTNQVTSEYSSGETMSLDVAVHKTMDSPKISNVKPTATHQKPHSSSCHPWHGKTSIAYKPGHQILLDIFQWLWPPSTGTCVQRVQTQVVV